ncbi:hypothetical protein [Rhodococcus sp. DMU1]|uniref:hypothetical protein n=1 Tax=Rhodococcus sp. DMU1 TaxID=2722825 RepID=UPI001FF09736|nr:hypothetical protein [Rhodococcus sp. DMU1]
MSDRFSCGTDLPRRICLHPGEHRIESDKDRLGEPRVGGRERIEQLAGAGHVGGDADRIVLRIRGDRGGRRHLGMPPDQVGGCVPQQCHQRRTFRTQDLCSRRSQDESGKSEPVLGGAQVARRLEEFAVVCEPPGGTPVQHAAALGILGLEAVSQQVSE